MALYARIISKEGQVYVVTASTVLKPIKEHKFKVNYLVCHVVASSN